MEYKTIKINLELYNRIKDRSPDISVAKAIQDLMDDKCPKAKQEILQPSDMSIIQNKVQDNIYSPIKESISKDLRESLQYYVNSRLKNMTDQIEDRFCRIESAFQR